MVRHRRNAFDIEKHNGLRCTVSVTAGGYEEAVDSGRQSPNVDTRSKRWITVADSDFDHEREALAFLRRTLPDRDPIQVWSNFEFVTRQGKRYEVDALIMTSSGLYLVEIKSHPGRIEGDANTLYWTPEPDKKPHRQLSMDHPLSLASRKAKAIKDLLDRSEEFRRAKKRAPFVSEVIFLSAPDLVVRLTQQGKFNVYGRDAESGEELPAGRRSIGGIVEAITTLEPDRNGRRQRRIDRPMADRVRRAITEIGIRERVERRTVGDWRLGELLDDVDEDRDTGVTYQDFVATHVAAEDVKRRVRIYPHEHNIDEDERSAAVRAARREFALLNKLTVDGVLRPFDFTETERGPALVFEYDPHAQPLHRWLEDGEVSLQLRVEDRVSLFRQIAETMLRAHQRGFTHRALSPTSIWVSGPHDAPVVRVANWHTATRIAKSETGVLSSSTTGHAEMLGTQDAVLYRAPEFGLDRANPVSIDVFSLGALATLIFTGHAPAESIVGLSDLMTDPGYVPAGALSSGLPDHLSDVIALATKADPSARVEDVPMLLELLDTVEEEWSLPEAPLEPLPDEARKGDTLGSGRFEVKGRLGKGSTAVALLASDHELGREVVLKAALDPEKNERLEFEAMALQELNHPNVVQLLDRQAIDLQGHSALVLSHAGKSTLASRLAAQPLEELSERFGRDLLEALRHLEEQGISHRDIKPENIGVAMRGARDELRLILYDFSLTEVEAERIEAGTTGYIDPFLRQPSRGRFDLHADRYSAAVTLYEMLTGAKPVYGDGTADPLTIEDGPRIRESDFDSSVAAGLVDFFERSLARDTADRFGTADEMLRAWLRAFEPAAQPLVAGGDGANPGAFVVPPGTVATTPLGALPLSARAVNAMNRADVLTVADLLAFPNARIMRLPGVGSKTRQELFTAVAALRDVVVGESEGRDEVPAVSDEPAMLSAIVEQLIPVERRADAASTTETLSRLLGIVDGSAAWPTQTEVGKAVALTRARVQQIIVKARDRWLKQPALTPIRDWLADELEALGGLATTEQLVVSLVNRVRDPDLEPEANQAAARAVVRAALEAERKLEQPRWLLRRRATGAVAVALESSEAGEPTGAELADYAASLASATEAAVADEPVISRPRLASVLAEVRAPQGAKPMSDPHLATLATALSLTAAINARLEVYRAGLAPAIALEQARRSFSAAQKLTAEDVIAKVQARFPEAEVLPARPELDQLLADANIGLVWDEEEQHYVSPSLTSTASSSTSIHREATSFGRLSNPVAAVETDEAVEFEARLARQHDNGGLFVVVTDRKEWMSVTVRELERFNVATVDLDAVIMSRLEAITADGKPSMQMLFEADRAGAGGAQWANLQKVLDRVFADITRDLLATSGTVVLHQLGLLARYDRIGLLSQIREALHDGDHQLGAVWVVTTRRAQVDAPMIDGSAIPVLDHEWARVPRRWLENAHRVGANGA